MRVGIYVDVRNPAWCQRDWKRHYARTLEMITEAEHLGVDAVWMPEHHMFEDGYIPQSLTFAAAIAARTDRVRIGTALVILPLHPVMHVAEQAAIVDLVSGGRLELGVGAGYHPREFVAFGVDFDARYRVVGERVRELRRLWAEGHVTPAPLQQPIPLWVGSWGVQGARRAAQLGTGLLCLGRDLATMPGLVDAYVGGFAGPNASSARIASVEHLVLADDPDEAFARIAPHVAHQADTYRRYMVEGTGQPVPPPIDPERWCSPGRSGQPPRFEILTAETAISNLRARLSGKPVTDVIVWPTVAGMPDDLVERNLELIGTELMPGLRHS